MFKKNKNKKENSFSLSERKYKNKPVTKRIRPLAVGVIVVFLALFIAMICVLIVPKNQSVMAQYDRQSQKTISARGNSYSGIPRDFYLFDFRNDKLNANMGASVKSSIELSKTQLDKIQVLFIGSTQVPQSIVQFKSFSNQLVDFAKDNKGINSVLQYVSVPVKVDKKESNPSNNPYAGQNTPTYTYTATIDGYSDLVNMNAKYVTKTAVPQVVAIKSVKDKNGKVTTSVINVKYDISGSTAEIIRTNILNYLNKLVNESARVSNQLPTSDPKLASNPVTTSADIFDGKAQYTDEQLMQNMTSLYNDKLQSFTANVQSLDIKSLYDALVAQVGGADALHEKGLTLNIATQVNDGKYGPVVTSKDGKTQATIVLSGLNKTQVNVSKTFNVGVSTDKAATYTTPDYVTTVKNNLKQSYIIYKNYVDVISSNIDKKIDNYDANYKELTKDQYLKNPINYDYSYVLTNIISGQLAKPYASFQVGQVLDASGNAVVDKYEVYQPSYDAQGKLTKNNLMQVTLQVQQNNYQPISFNILHNSDANYTYVLKQDNKEVKLTQENNQVMAAYNLDPTKSFDLVVNGVPSGMFPLVKNGSTILAAISGKTNEYSIPSQTSNVMISVFAVKGVKLTFTQPERMIYNDKPTISISSNMFSSLTVENNEITIPYYETVNVTVGPIRAYYLPNVVVTSKDIEKTHVNSTSNTYKVTVKGYDTNVLLNYDGKNVKVSFTKPEGVTVKAEDGVNLDKVEVNTTVKVTITAPEGKTIESVKMGDTVLQPKDGKYEIKVGQSDVMVTVTVK